MEDEVGCQQPDDVADRQQRIGDTELIVFQHVHPYQHGCQRTGTRGGELPGREDGFEVLPRPREITEQLYGNLQKRLCGH